MNTKKPILRKLAETMAGTDRTFILVFYITPTDNQTPSERFQKTVDIEDYSSQDNSTKIEVELDGPTELVKEINQKLGYDLLANIQKMANKISPSDCIDDYEYLEETGLKDLKTINSSSGEKVLEVVPSGYKVINKYVFDNHRFSPIEASPFIEIQFKA